MQSTNDNTPVALQYTDDNGNKKYLFRGLVTDIKQYTISGLKHLEVEAHSFSYQLDVKKHSQSFQREGEPYSYIFQRINALAREYIPNLKDDVVVSVGNEDAQTPGRLIVQYKETEWRFLMRLASHFNEGLIPDITFDSPKIYFGFPPESQQGDNENQGPEFNVSTYQIKRDTGFFASSSSNYRNNSGITFTQNDFTSIEAQSLDVLQLGQKVTFLNREWYVKKIRTTMDKHAANNLYTLTTKQGLMQDDQYNSKLAGISLHAVVKKVTNDQVRAHIIEIDDKWDEGSTWYFPYMTVYSSPDGSGWYCMPELEDNVRIYFPNYKEEQAVAASSVNLTPSKRGARTDPDSKILSTVYGKQVLLTPAGINIISNDNLLMTLTDDGGVTINSDKKIVFEAEEEIEITSKTSKVEVTAQEEISLKQGSGEINIKDEINVKGSKVKIQP